MKVITLKNKKKKIIRKIVEKTIEDGVKEYFGDQSEKHNKEEK